MQSFSVSPKLYPQSNGQDFHPSIWLFAQTYLCLILGWFSRALILCLKEES